LEALPGIASLTLVGRYPIAEVSYSIPGFPVQVALEAFSPMCPLDNKNSSLPAAVFTFTLTNTGTTPVAVRLLHSQQNFVGWAGHDDCTPPNATPFWGGNVNTSTATGINLSNPSQPSGTDRSNTTFGTLALEPVPTGATPATATVILDGTTEEDIFAKFTSGADVPPSAGKASPASAAGTSYCAGLVQSVTVPANGTATVTFVLSWHFPNRSNKGR
jgi:uncharacterized protein (DUF608 family)